MRPTKIGKKFRNPRGVFSRRSVRPASVLPAAVCLPAFHPVFHPSVLPAIFPSFPSCLSSVRLSVRLIFGAWYEEMPVDTHTVRRFSGKTEILAAWYEEMRSAVILCACPLAQDEPERLCACPPAQDEPEGDSQADSLPSGRSSCLSVLPAFVPSCPAVLLSHVRPVFRPVFLPSVCPSCRLSVLSVLSFFRPAVLPSHFRCVV